MLLLKEFDLDLPYQPDKRKLFRQQTRCVTSLFERHFGKFKTENCWKLLIECVKNVEKENYRDLIGVYAIQIKFSPDSFFQLSDMEKKTQTIDLLMMGINRLILQTKWDIKPFEEAYKAAVDLNLENHWVWKKPVKSPSKKLSAEILCEHEVTVCKINIIIRDKNGIELSRKLILSEEPDEFAYAKHLGHLKWDSEDCVMLYNKKNDKAWSVNLSDTIPR